MKEEHKFLLTLVLATLIALWAMQLQRDELKAEAVKRGAAEWVVDPTNGATTFMWKEPTK
jgi:hypothetical protein